MSYRPIDDYAIIGNCRTAALISRSGSLDWLCLPRFDGPSLFAALLDADRGGRFRVGPVEDATIERRYLDDSAILETTFTTPSGRFRLTDLMPVRSEAEKGDALWPDHAILRVIEGIEGEPECEVVFAPRPDYATRVARLDDRGPLGLVLEHHAGLCNLRSDIPLVVSGDRSSAHGRFHVRAGQRYVLSLAFSRDEPAVLAPLGDQLEKQISQSLR